MELFAAVTTQKATGAISTVQLFGETSTNILQKIFKPSGNSPASFETGNILVGSILDDNQTIDQVAIGCEGKNSFAIHCHGNTLIVELIMQLLKKLGAKLITAEKLLAKTLNAEGKTNSIAAEAKIIQANAKTLEATKMIACQIDSGLSEKANHWLSNFDSLSLDKIISQAEEVLQATELARPILNGIKVVIAGPPNSGKSTLLNCLCGREKAIVTDIKGTTRDWVTGNCKMGPLYVELFDTAGLDDSLITDQKKNIESELPHSSEKNETPISDSEQNIDAQSQNKIQQLPHPSERDENLSPATNENIDTKFQNRTQQLPHPSNPDETLSPATNESIDTQSQNRTQQLPHPSDRDENLSPATNESIDAQSQNKTRQLLRSADIIMLVLDSSEPPELLNDQLKNAFCADFFAQNAQKLLLILNKSDLNPGFDPKNLPQTLQKCLKISAESAKNTEKIPEMIKNMLKISLNFDPSAAICTTTRQKNLMNRIISSKTKPKTLPVITELLNGEIFV